MTAANPQMLNQYVMQVLNIQPEDIEVNRLGKISPRQEANYQQLSGRNLQAMKRYVWILPLIIGGMIIREVVSSGTNPLEMIGGMFSGMSLLSVAMMIVMFAIIGVVGFMQMRSFGERRVLMVEGSAKLSLASEGNYQTRAMVAAMGIDPMRGRLKIGKKTFQVSERVLRGFQPDATYRAYYVQFGAVTMLIGAEAVEA